jgi:hypothetical protein
MRRKKKQQLQNNTRLVELSPKLQTRKHMSGRDGNDEVNDNEMENYEVELQQCARAAGVDCQRQVDNAAESLKASKKRKTKTRLITRPVSQEDVPLPENLSTRILSAVYKEDIFEDMAHLAAFKARFQDQMEKPKRRLALEEYTKMLWHQVFIYFVLPMPACVQLRSLFFIINNASVFC